MAIAASQIKADFFKSLGHPARIAIVELLCESDMAVSQLQAALGLEASHLSQQLGVLRRAGIVSSQKNGNSVVYSIAAEDMPDLLAIAQTVLRGIVERQAAIFTDR